MATLLPASPWDHPAEIEPTISHGHVEAGTGTPVVLLHSSLGSKSQWTPLVQRLSSRYRVVALDLCGYGDHEAPTMPLRDFTLDDEIAFLARRLDALVGAGTRIHLVGHSYGGVIALRWARCQPERVASLVLYEPVVFNVLDSEEDARATVDRLARDVADLVASGRRYDAARSFVDFWNGQGSFAGLPLPAQAALVRRVAKVPYDFRAATRWPMHDDDLRGVVAPVLLMIGNRGPAAVPKIHERLGAVLRNRRVAAFDCGHMGPVTDANRVNPWIEAFVDVCCERDAAASQRDHANATL